MLEMNTVWFKRGLSLLFRCIVWACLLFVTFSKAIDRSNHTVVSKRPATRQLRSKGDHHHKMYHQFNSSNENPHKKSWMALQEVDGLRNEDVVMLVTSTWGKKFFYIRSRIIQSARTWMRMFANVFVIVEDTFEVRFAMRHCKVVEYARFTSYECHNEPTYVLSRKCTNQYYGGAGPCCKVDEIMSFITTDQPDLFRHTKYVLHCDDDTYFRTDQVLKWLAAFENSGVNSLPIIMNFEWEHAHGNTDTPHTFNMKSGCHEVRPNGWYQPMVINHAALEKMKVAHLHYGLMDTCNTFGVTHDVGMGPFAWLFGLYHAQIPQGTVTFRGEKHEFNPGFMIIHSIKHHGADNCANNTLYDQRMIIGCGDHGRPFPGHSRAVEHNMIADMYEAWDFYRDHGVDPEIYDTFWSKRNVTFHPFGTMLNGVSTTGDEARKKIKHILEVNDTISSDSKFNGDQVFEVNIPKLNVLYGHELTNHSRFDLVKEWHPFNLNDCGIPGTIGR